MNKAPSKTENSKNIYEPNDALFDASKLLFMNIHNVLTHKLLIHIKTSTWKIKISLSVYLTVTCHLMNVLIARKLTP